MILKCNCADSPSFAHCSTLAPSLLHNLLQETLDTVGLWSQKLEDAMIEKPTMELRNVTAMPKVCDVILHVPDLCVYEA